MTWVVATHRCWCHRLEGGRTVRDTRSWDAVTGRCGRCGLLYRQQVRLVEGVDPVPPPRPPVVEDLEPTGTGDVVPFRRGR